MYMDLFVAILIVGVVLLLIAYFEKTIGLTALSLLFWLFIFAQSLYIETATDSYTEYALNIVSFGIVIFNVVLLIADIMYGSINKKFRL